MNHYNKISPDVRKELESQLAARFTKTSKTGMAKRLLKGEDVENHLTKTFKEHSDKTTKDIDKKTQDAIVSINLRIDAVLKYMQSVVQAKVDGIRAPENGRTPSADEIKALLSPMVDETRTQFTQRISKIEDLLTKAPKESDVPTDLKGLEAFVKSKIPKLGGGGGGASYLFELFDTPAKSKSKQGAYVGYEGLALSVSDDGKRLVFRAGGGGHTIEDEGTPLTQRDDLNFVGAGVTVTDAGGKTVVTIPGGSAGSGDVVGPASAVDNNFAAFDTTTGKLIKDSGSKASDFATAAQGTKADSAQQPPSEGAFVDGDKTKLDGIEASADATDATNVQAAGALMESEVTNLAEVKAFDSTDYATEAQGATADAALLYPTFSQNFPRSLPTASEDMDSGWTDEFGNGTAAHDATDYQTGAGSIKITTSTDTLYCGMSKAVTYDFSASDFAVWVKSDDWTETAIVQIRFYDSTGDFYFLDMATYFIDKVDDEWMEMQLTKGLFSKSGTPDWSDITEIFVNCNSTSGNSVNVWYDGLRAFPSATRPVVSISFDDSRATGYSNGIKYMEEKGMVGTMFAIPSLLGTANYMTQAEIDAIAKNGWDISGHGATNLTTLSDAAQKADLLATATWLNEANYPGANIYAYPNGANDDEVRDNVRRYFPVARTINYINQPLGYVNPMRINAYSPISSTTYAQIKAYIDYAVANNEWCILTFHSIVASPTVSTELATATFESVIDYLGTLDIDVLPISRVLEQDWTQAAGSSSGDVVGPASATDNAIARFDSTTGKLLQDSNVTISDADAISGATALTTTGNITIDGVSGPGNAFTILNRKLNSNFAAFQFQTAGTTIATIGAYNTSNEDVYLQLDSADAGRRQTIHFVPNSETVFNEDGGDMDFRVEGDTDANLLVADASTDRVGIGTNTPQSLLDVDGTARVITLNIGGTDVTATAAEINYSDGVTSNIQTQLGAKAPTASPTFTGTVVLPNSQALVTPVLGTPTSATLTNATGLPISGLVNSTSLALGLGTIELGNASDTTLSRSAAGVLAVEGVVVPTISSTSTFTNKRVNPRTNSTTTAATLAPDLSVANVYFRTTQTATLTISAPIGTPVIGETLYIEVSSVASQTLTINATYIPFGAAFPAATTAGKSFLLTCTFNGTNWRSTWANEI